MTKNICGLLFAFLVTACGSVGTNTAPCSTASDCVAKGDQCGIPACVEGVCLFAPDESCCGNGILDDGETCDDGNDEGGDDCPSDCGFAPCGNGNLDEGEECDAGFENADTPNAPCRLDCRLPSCGDGIIDTESGEECDDKNTFQSDSCLNTCVKARCGDGFIHQSVEECDLGFENSDQANASCRTDCTEARCGDGITDDEVGETCDDGNNDNTDDCVEGCLVAVCGDSYVHQANEECDDGNEDNTDNCVQECKNAVCGDSFVHEGVEECDLGINNSDVSNSNCRTNCILPFCGDGIVDDLPPLSESCDDGNSENNDACVTDCVVATCGDGFIRTVGDPEDIEECDEGALNSDEPDAPCRLSCIIPHCGDGIPDPGLNEQCDDGGAGAGEYDACSNDQCAWSTFKVPMSLSPEARHVAAAIDESGTIAVAWTTQAGDTPYRYIYATKLAPNLQPYTVFLGNQNVPTGVGSLISTPQTVALNDTLLVTSTQAGFIIGWNDFQKDFCLKNFDWNEDEQPKKVIDSVYGLPGMEKDPSELILAKEATGTSLLAGWVDIGRDDCPTFDNNGVCGDDACPNANDCTDCNNCGLNIASVVRVDAESLNVSGALPSRHLASPLTGHVENLSFCVDAQGYAHGITGTLRSQLDAYESVYARSFDGSNEADAYFDETSQETFFEDISTQLTIPKESTCLMSGSKRLVMLPVDKLSGDDPIYVSYENNATNLASEFAFEGPGFSSQGSGLHEIKGDPDNLVAVMTSTLGNDGLELAGSFFQSNDFIGDAIDSLSIFDADPSDNTDTIHESATVVVYPDFSHALFLWVHDGAIMGRVHPWGTQ